MIRHFQNMIRTMLSLKPLLPVVMVVSLSACSQEKIDDNESLLKEKYRPQFHFSPLTKWTNDPNGMVFYQGEYHLFYQHYPNSSVWGPMHWGHAVSEDLIHWEHLPIALYPDTLGYIFSGSAVVDWQNSSGFGTPSSPPLVAIFTYHDPVKDSKGLQCQSQGIAYSTDKGRTWTKYENNPVLESPGIWNFRDPKVRWYEPTNRWIMTLACGDHVRFYSSPDLKSWTLESEFGKDAGFHDGTWECPDLFPVAVEDSGETKWVLIVSNNPGGLNGGSGTQYFTGDFNGKTFLPDTKESKWLDYGTDNYAGVTWSDIPEDDGRQIFLGWMSNWQYANVVPTTIWRNAMTLPRGMKLKQLPSGYVLHSFPVKEVDGLRDGSQNILSTLKAGQPVETDSTFELEVALTIPEESTFSLVLTSDQKDSVVVTINKEHMSFDRTKAGVTDFEKGFAAKHSASRPMGREVKLRVFVDASSVEIFANDGEVVMTELIFPRSSISTVSVVHDPEADVREAILYTLSSIWIEKQGAPD